MGKHRIMRENQRNNTHLSIIRDQIHAYLGSARFSKDMHKFFPYLAAPHPSLKEQPNLCNTWQQNKET
jgi:hypothetical protein